jgi:plasmid maintenance system antidote protein VapI
MVRIWRWIVRLIKITNVLALEPFKLSLSFSDGSTGIADLSGDLEGPFAVLNDHTLWNRVHLKRGVVTWNDDLDLAPEFLYARAHQLEAPKTVEEVHTNQLVVTMRELRALAGKSQVEVAEAMGVAQAEVSRLEGRADTRLSTIERYVKALGGEVEVVAKFGDRSLRLHLG